MAESRKEADECRVWGVALAAFQEDEGHLPGSLVKGSVERCWSALLDSFKYIDQSEGRDPHAHIGCFLL